MKESDEKILPYVSAAIVKLIEDQTIEIAPSLIASIVMKEIDPKQISPMLVAYNCNIHIREVARKFLARKLDPAKTNNHQQQLFDGLQTHYPTKRNGEPTYVERMHMTLAEREVIPKRLRHEAAEKMKHADAFEAETQYLIEQGYFKEIA